MKGKIIKKYFFNKIYSKSHARFFSVEREIKQKNQWNSVIGLEIHAQITSNSKLFSGASTEFGNAANSCVSFFDSAMPGTLPVLNKQCVEAGVLTALALSCQVNKISQFDRKHYFYPDLPAGYQITQQRLPLAINGQVEFNVSTPGKQKKPYTKISKLKQVQLEQDSGKSLHDDSSHQSFIDLNRAGVPLIEFVFEPDLTDGEEAASLVKELILILQRLNTCTCKMDEGALRVDANISVNKSDEPIGTRTEIKNIGSVRAVASAIKYEINRQISILERGNKIYNETRAWNVEAQKTVSLRDKEDKQDYRFMPEPNLPPLRLDTKTINSMKQKIPELPQKTRDNLKTKFQLPSEMILVLVNEPLLLKLFHFIIENDSKRSPFQTAKILVYEILAFANKNNLSLEYCFSLKDHIAELIDLLQYNKINLLIAHRVLEKIVQKSGSCPKQIVDENNWTQICDDEELTCICKNVLNNHPVEVKKYKAGKVKLLQFFKGQIVKITDQRANMANVDRILKKLLE